MALPLTLATKPVRRPRFRDFLLVPCGLEFDGVGWKDCLFDRFRLKSLGKMYVGPGLSAPWKGVCNRFESGQEGWRQYRSTSLHSFFVIPPCLGRGSANVVPDFMLGRTSYVPGPGVSLELPALCFIRLWPRKRTERKSAEVDRISPVWTGPRRVGVRHAWVGAGDLGK